jgi:cysteine desulfurase
MTGQRIYADNAATTAVSDTAFEAMLPYFRESYGNPSAIHSFGAYAKRAVENARRAVAASIGARVNEVFFTSGGTESDNWALLASAALRGGEKRRGKNGRHIITTEIEHNAVYRTAQHLEKSGFEVTYLMVDRFGLVAPEQLAEAIRDDTILVSIMTANNEIGTIQPIGALCDIAKKHGALFHTDAVQAVGHIPVDVRALGVDMLSISAHKFHGPKGVGALYVGLGTALPAMLLGGGQEKGRRSGTSNVAGAVGMAAALEDAVRRMEERSLKTVDLRDRLIEGILRLPGAELTGHPDRRLPGLASFLFKDIQGEPLVSALNEAGICASSGSACSAGSGEPSRVLKAAGVVTDQPAAPLRLSLSEYNTAEEIDEILRYMPLALKKAAAERLITQALNLDDI